MSAGSIRKTIGGALLAVLALSSTGLAQDRRLTVNPASASQRKRALVVGNNAYTGAPLVNAVNDANAVGAELRTLGFQVDSLLNASAEQFTRALDQFVNVSRPDDAVVFYYSGHGVQIDGLNYLVPTDFTGGDEVALKFRGINVSEFEGRLERKGVRVRIMVLDACRDNPFRGTRAAGGGLAPPQSPEGSLVAFATAAGRTASDNRGDTNGLFTKYFLQGLKQPGVTATDMFRWIRLQVREASAGRQVPSLYDGLIGDFVFYDDPAAVAAAAERERLARAAEEERQRLERAAAAERERLAREAAERERLAREAEAERERQRRYQAELAEQQRRAEIERQNRLAAEQREAAERAAEAAAGPFYDSLVGRWENTAETKSDSGTRQVIKRVVTMSSRCSGVLERTVTDYDKGFSGWKKTNEETNQLPFRCNYRGQLISGLQGNLAVAADRLTLNSNESNATYDRRK